MILAVHTLVRGLPVSINYKYLPKKFIQIYKSSFKDSSYFRMTVTQVEINEHLKIVF